MSESKSQNQNQETKKNTLLVSGVVTSARIGKTKFSEESKNRLTLKSDTIPYDDIHAYDNVGKKLTPKWYSDQNGYINLSSMFDIPVKTLDGRIHTFEEWIDDFNTIGAEVIVKIVDKDGSVYPMALVVHKDGEDLDPFEGM